MSADDKLGGYKPPMNFQLADSTQQSIPLQLGEVVVNPAWRGSVATAEGRKMIILETLHPRYGLIQMWTYLDAAVAMHEWLGRAIADVKGEVPEQQDVMPPLAYGRLN